MFLDHQNCLFQRFSNLAYVVPEFYENPSLHARMACDSLQNGTATWREFCGFESLGVSNLTTPPENLPDPLQSKPRRKATGAGVAKFIMVPLDIDDYLRPSIVWVGMSRGML